MKFKQIIILGICLSSLFLLVHCDDNSSNPDQEKEYVTIECTGFMTLANDVIADSLSTIFETGGITGEANLISIGYLFHDNLKIFVDYGYEYTANNGDKIRVWIGNDGKPLFATYLNTGDRQSEYLTLDTNTAFDLFRTNLFKYGVETILDNGLQYSGFESQSVPYSYYGIYYTQPYNNSPVGLPYFYSKIAGDTSKINFLCITRYYANLDSIRDTLSHQELKTKACDYFVKQYKRQPYMEHISIEGHYIIYDKLCVKTGPLLIGEYDELYLYQDIQNADIIETDLIGID